MKTYVYIGTSLDGFIAGKDGDISWLHPYMNPDVVRSYSAFINQIDAIVIGRGTFETALSFSSWPYNRQVYILSNSLKELPGTIKGKATLLAMTPQKLLDHLNKEGLSHIYIDGGKVIQSFLKENLVDELIITRVPVLIGTGIPLFGDLKNLLSFTHIKTEVLEGGLVKSHYRK
jgi:dihydrofolate reductase